MKSHTLASLAVTVFLFTSGLFVVHGEEPHWESIKKRVESAVERGDMTREEADRKYAEIKKGMAEKKRGAQAVRDDKVDPRKKKYMQAEREMKEAVKAGKLSEKDAKRRLDELKQHLWGSDRGGDHRKAHHAHGERGVLRQLETGVISRDDALEAMIHGFEAAVELGRMSEEEAVRRIEDLHRERDMHNQRNRELHAVMERGIRAALELGKISEQDARAIMEGSHEGHRDRRGHRDAREHEAREQKFHAMERKIDDAVRRGEISEEEARQKIHGLKRELFGDR